MKKIAVEMENNILRKEDILMILGIKESFLIMKTKPDKLNVEANLWLK